jgi:exodeoxyribonuclease X
MQDIIAAVFDTETTDLHGEIIQIGFMGLVGHFVDDNIDPEAYSKDFKPEGKIAYGAMATHHILDEELDGCDPSSSYVFPSSVQYMIGHNIDYDWEVSGKPEVKRIDTLAMSRKLFKEDSHSLSAMIYRLSDDKKAARDMVRGAHNAKADVEMTYWLLLKLIDESNARLRELNSVFMINSWETLYQFSEHCRVPDFMPFGKHKGELIKDLPASYVKWYRSQEKVDEYIIKAFAKHFPLVI